METGRLNVSSAMKLVRHATIDASRLRLYMHLRNHRFRLTLTVTAKESAVVRTVEVSQSPHSRRRRRPSVRQMIVDYLGDNEIQVTAIESGRLIEDVMAGDTIDLLILDLRLPGENGMEIARRIRADSRGCQSSCSPGARRKPTA